jgi:uncharacterized protein YlxW (UPF0749 family)
MQQFIQYTGAAIEGVTSLVGAMSAFNKENATAEERANALTQGFVGVGAAIADAFVPGLGMVVRMAGGLLDALGITKLFTSWLETDAEKANRIAQEIENANQRFNEYVASLQNELNSLQDSINKYKELEKSLDNMVEGTDK